MGGQLRGDKECPFSGVTKSGTVWRTVPESDARSVCSTITSEPVGTGRSQKIAERAKAVFSTGKKERELELENFILQGLYFRFNLTTPPC